MCMYTCTKVKQNKCHNGHQQVEEVKTSGSFKRKLNKNLSVILKTPSQQASPVQCTIFDTQNELPQNTCSDSPYPPTDEHVPDFNLQHQPEPHRDADSLHSDDEAWQTLSDDDYEEDDEDTKNETLFSALRSWSIAHNIKQAALKDLISIINDRIPNVLPKDPRTLLQTVKEVNLNPVGEGKYWHHGLRQCLENVFVNTNEARSISININLDGLPVYKSSKDEFWPILFNIHEMNHIRPMVIGIYSGKSKPTDLNAFLDQFVDELLDILTNGIIINDHKITVNIRCFICDSPARSFIKGVAYFNAQNGCQKCTACGEYSYVSHCNYYPLSNSAVRTDSGFRSKSYGSHHKMDTPLLRLPIDMIADFPVGDSLHLIDLGIMKKCLIGWRDGKFGNYRTKWSAQQASDITKYLTQLKLPSEIHRKVRGLDCLSHWKGTEFRTFLLYVGIVALKPFLPEDVYEHFLIFFCAITICSCESYCHLVELAESLLQHYVERYADIYGEDYISSNVHNLSHLTKDVKRFGVLSSFSAYPFESKLYHIKNVIRSGHKPLAQAAKRISELNQLENCDATNSSKTSPVLKKRLSTSGTCDVYEKVEFNTFTLSNTTANNWFLTNNNQVVCFDHAIQQNENICILGSTLKHTSDYFPTPVKSRHLNVFISNGEKATTSRYAVSDIKCKMVGIPLPRNNTEMVFIPLLHTVR